jgi:hypothetical protein
MLELERLDHDYVLPTFLMCGDGMFSAGLHVKALAQNLYQFPLVGSKKPESQTSLHKILMDLKQLFPTDQHSICLYA